MKKLLAMLLALVLLALPTLSLAEGDATIGIIGGADGPTSVFVAGENAPNMGTLLIENFQLGMNGEDPVDAAMTAQLTAGADETGRGVLDVSLSVNGKSVLDATAALEDGMLKATMTGLSQAVGMPLDGSLQMDANASAFLETYVGAFALLESPEYVEQVEKRVKENLPKYLTQVADAESVVIVDRVHTLPKWHMTLNLQDFPQLMNDIYGPEYMQMLNDLIAAEFAMMGTEMEAMDFEALLQTMADEGVEIAYDIDIWGDMEDPEAADVRVDMKMHMTVEDETVTVPISMEVAQDDMGTTALFSMLMDVEGVSMSLSGYAHELAYAGHTSDNLIINLNVDESGEQTSVQLNVSNRVTPDAQTNFNGALNVSSYGEEISGQLSYTGSQAESEDGGVEYDGHVTLAGQMYGEEAFQADFDTLLSLYKMPDAAFIDPSLPVLEFSLDEYGTPTCEDENALNQLALEAQSTLMNVVFSMMGSPLLSGLMSEIATGAMA